ncbi:hypothetical protein NpPPO83_00006685 [Neofusicoccum parvum]|uniref:Uncharacterized protein n=1 Tax=Neofusicoccum parvum TaxID=310453 RepID=A0ACB5SDT8_9PEZI|nr:hypothetical protein NpPPO83_00006685 [Neofusicoccum parvum]
MDRGDPDALLILKRGLATCAAALWMMTLAPFTPTLTEAFDSAVVAFTQRLGPVHPTLLVLRLEYAFHSYCFSAWRAPSPTTWWQPAS